MPQAQLTFEDVRNAPSLAKPGQVDRVFNYLLEFGSITPVEALRDLGLMRLGARIWELRHRLAEAGQYALDSDLVEVPTRWGTTAHVARYTLRRLH